MHDKLSQAVKLYDKLLTEQIAHPRWRSPQAAAGPSPDANQAYGAVNGYTQWASSLPVAATTYQSPSSQWQPSSPVQQYAQSPPQPYAHIPTQTQASSPTSQEPQRQHSSYVEPPRIYHQQQHQTPLTSQVPVLPAVTINPQQYQYAAQSPPPVSIQHVTLPPPPPLQQRLQQATPTSPPTSTLNRAKTISFAAPPVTATGVPVAQAPSPIVNGHLGRSNTVTAWLGHAHSQSMQHNWAPPAHARQEQHHQQILPQQIQQQLMSVPVPPSNVIPEFPVVPMEVPQQQEYTIYGSGGGMVQKEERKEGLLIDL